MFLRPRRLMAIGCLALICGFGPALTADAEDMPPLPVQEIASGIYVHQGVPTEATAGNLGGIANIGFIIGDRTVAVIDTGGSAREGAALLAAIRRVTRLPIGYVINTHFHPDHILGNAAFMAEKPVFMAHANFPRDLAARSDGYLATARSDLGDAFQGTSIVMPKRLMRMAERIDLGHRSLLLTPYPPAHSDADLTVLDEKTGTLFAGDLLFVDRVPAVDGSITGWLKAIDALQKVPAQRAVPGHGPVSVAWPTALAGERHYLDAIAAAVRLALKNGLTLQEAVDDIDRRLRVMEQTKWQLFDDYDGRNITAAYTELEWE